MMDNDREEKGLLEGLPGVVQLPLREGDGLRRSRKLRDVPPGNPTEGGGGSTVGEMKRARQQEEEEVHVLKGAAVGDEDGVKVNPRGSTEEEEAHPCIFIENILDVVFKHIISQSNSRRMDDVAKDVRSIRLVCQTWKDSVTRAYRTSSAPPITFDEHDDVWVCHSRGMKTFAEFMDTMRLSRMLPIQKFKFCGIVFRDETWNLLEEFFRLCGPEVASLDLEFTPAEDMLIPKNLPELNMPKLRRLKLEIFYHTPSPADVNGPAEGHGYGIANLAEHLLTAAKNLTEFQFSYFPPWNLPYWDEQLMAMEQLGPILATGIPKTVKQLKLNLELSESTFNDLAGVGLKLERFEIGISSRLADKTLYQFLLSQGDSLKHLAILSPHEAETQPGTSVEFPPLGELLQLELSNVMVRFASPSDFSRAFPKLQRLEIPRMSREEPFGTLLSSVKTPSRSLRTIHLPNWLYSSLAPLIKNVGQSFPSIVELDIQLYNHSKKTLLEVFRCLDTLESLKIDFFENVLSAYWADSLFSGISQEDCTRIGRLQDFGEVDLNELQRQPSLLNLKKLRKLVMENFMSSLSNTFTDFAAHFVFMEMASLRDITFQKHVMHPILFTPRYADMLRDRLAVRGGTLNLMLDVW